MVTYMVIFEATHRLNITPGGALTDGAKLD